MKRRIIFLSATLVCLLVSSCSSNLTRSKAEEIIRENHPFATKEVDEFYLYWAGHCFQHSLERGPCGPDAMSESEKALQSSGLITVTFEGNNSRIALTPKGQQYAVGAPVDLVNRMDPLSKVTVVKRTVEFAAITGITQAEDSKTARVEYTLLAKPTPFGIAYGLAPTTESAMAIFTKYDDGWRIGQ